MKKTFLFMMVNALSFIGLSASNDSTSFDYNVEKFADLGILRYQVKGWEDLTLNQKHLIYYLSEAALHGRDILFDQNNRYNLAIRRTLEAVYTQYQGDKTNKDFLELEIYLKRIWFSNGIHHHYGEEKFLPQFSVSFFTESVKSIDSKTIPTRKNQSIDEFLTEIIPVMFDPNIYPKKVNQDTSQDVIMHSANNYYGENITQQEVETYYAAQKTPNDTRPISAGLNSRLVKENGKLSEKTYKIGGLYSAAIERIVYFLGKAALYAENAQQKQVIDLLINYYQTGCLHTFDKYSIAWVQDTQSQVDFVNGFIETYGDALGIKASWESLVNFKNIEATRLSEVIGENAQWFENHSPIDPRFKKKEVKGVSAKVITAAMLGGDCYPATPIGINLPNADWIRKEYGSKSVTITNITEAYDNSTEGSGFNEEFVWSDAERDLLKKYGSQTDNLHTDLHECLGHGSGQLLPGVDPDALKIYGATIEETRADLFGLYYVADNKMLELGLLDNKEAYKAQYYKYTMNGLMTQLARIELGKNIEESHMRNRALIAHWLLEKGAGQQVIELVKKDNKTYVVIRDYEKMRELIGELLAVIQRIKSEGDYEGAKQLIEKYAVRIDANLHQEIKERYAKLNIAPYKGFVNPVYVKQTNNNETDIIPTYTEGYAEQMLRYSRDYSHLPTYND